jgi:uncharacterized protein (DUF433 family)
MYLVRSNTSGSATASLAHGNCARRISFRSMPSGLSIHAAMLPCPVRGGAWVFRDTRTPVSVVFDNLEVGASISEIMEWFHLTHEQVVAVIEFAARIHYVRRQSKGRHENDTRPS